jgi:hypothetical protein
MKARRLRNSNAKAYRDVVPLTVGLAPDVAFARALDTAQRMDWTIVASDKAAGRIEASQKSRWMGFTDDVVVRVTPASSGSASTYARLRAMGAVISALMPRHSRLPHGVARRHNQPRLAHGPLPWPFSCRMPAMVGGRIVPKPFAQHIP